VVTVQLRSIAYPLVKPALNQSKLCWALDELYCVLDELCCALDAAPVPPGQCHQHA
jgi:hypothetical protein